MKACIIYYIKMMISCMCLRHYG